MTSIKNLLEVHVATLEIGISVSTDFKTILSPVPSLIVPNSQPSSLMALHFELFWLHIFFLITNQISKSYYF